MAVCKHITPVSLRADLKLNNCLLPYSRLPLESALDFLTILVGKCITIGKWSDISEYTIAETELIIGRLTKILSIRVVVSFF